MKIVEGFLDLFEKIVDGVSDYFFDWVDVKTFDYLPFFTELQLPAVDR